MKMQYLKHKTGCNQIISCQLLPMLTQLPRVKKRTCGVQWPKQSIAIILSWMADKIQSVAHSTCLSIDSCKKAFYSLYCHLFTFIGPKTTDCLSFIASWEAFVNGENRYSSKFSISHLFPSFPKFELEDNMVSAQSDIILDNWPSPVLRSNWLYPTIIVNTFTDQK